MKTIHLIAALIISLQCFNQSLSRELISTTGNFFTNGSINISWSLGETVTETVTTPNVILTQGFQQPDFTGLQILQIHEGWSGISTYLIPAQKEVDRMFAPLGLSLHILYNQQGIFWPDGGIYTLNDWDYESGYVIKSGADATLFIPGFLTDDKCIQLPAGWSIMPVLSPTEISIDVFNPLSSHLRVVKDVGGTGVYWPAMGINSLYALIPGKAYYIMLTDADSVTFSPAAKSKSVASKPVTIPCEAWETSESTPISHLVGIKHEAMALFNEGDYVGAFNKKGECVGYTQVTNMMKNTSLTVFGGDGSLNENSGILTGEEISFRAWLTQTQQQVNISPVFAESDELNNTYFVENGISVIEAFNITHIGINEDLTNEIQVFPNPTRGIFTISGLDNQAEIFIINVVGEVIGHRTEIMENQAVFDFNGKEPGLYFIKVKTGNKMLSEKLVLL